MEKSDVEMRDATDQLQDQNNEEVHPQNGCVDVQPLNNDDKLPHSATVQDTKPAELATQEALGGVTESKDKVDAAKTTESELQNSNSKDIVNGLEVTSGNVDQDQPLGEKTREDQHIKDSEVEKTPEEKVAVPAELIVEKASYNETGVNEEMKEIKDDEPSNGEALASGNVSMEIEPKQSEKMAALTSTLEDGVTQESKLPEAEREGNDADNNTTEAMVDAPKANVKEDIPTTAAVDTNASSRTSLDEQKPTISPSMIRCPSTKSGGQGEESYKNMFNEIKMTGDENGTPQEQAAFIRVLENFYRERAMEFKAPRFYGQQLNCLKLWRSVIKLGGYDRVTGCKLWRQVGESFHPPKTCTTISWTFRIFYEKALLEYERRVTESGELQLPQFPASDLSSVDNEMQGSVFQASGSGRARRDSATRAMQGWHSRLLGNSEGGEQIMKDKNGNNMKREKTIKSIGSLKQKRPDEVEHPVKAARTEPSKQLVSSVVDAGPPADWVRINVRETKDCYEVYALVPGLLREEVRVQSDPAGRLVITGQPDQPDNPWGITAFKKVISLPGRIDPLHTSAVVSLHGRLFVRVPFE